MLDLCTDFYRRTLHDDILGCLYIDKDQDEHARHLALFFCEKFGAPDKPYTCERGGACGSCACGPLEQDFNALEAAHKRGKACPLRDHKTHRQLPRETGTRHGLFTESQRERWLDNMSDSIDASKMERNCAALFLSYLQVASNKYGPFARDRKDGPTSKSKKRRRRDDGVDVSSLCRLS